MAQTVHFVAVDAASREEEPRNETQILWLELEVPVASPWWQTKFMCDGVDPEPRLLNPSSAFQPRFPTTDSGKEPFCQLPASPQRCWIQRALHT
jgi:hypothetical protein